MPDEDIGNKRSARAIVHREIAMVRAGPPEPAPYPAEKARGGEIILRRRWQRVVFVAGLAIPIILMILLMFAR